MEQLGPELLAQYGVIGLLLAVLGHFAKRAYDREADRADRLETELRDLHSQLRSEVMPTLTRAVLVLEHRQHRLDREAEDEQ